MTIHREKYLFIWRIILWLGAALFLAWLFYQNLVPTGVLILQHHKGSPASLISDLHPAKRVINEDDPLFRRASNNQTFYVDPVYFDVKVPRAFDKVMVDITWQNEAQPILELGARNIRGEFGFVLKPLQNKIIDNLKWPCQRQGQTLFCQRIKKYDNLESYLVNPSGRLLVYRYKPTKDLKHDIMNIETKVNDYDYLISDYTSPEVLDDNWYHRRITYQWRDFALHINEISFLLSAPQLNQGHGQITVGDIVVTLQRQPLDWKGFKEYVKNQLRRFK